ncbi:hypothetical protein [Paraburkholderia sp. J12]|uniref:hypothetical protein n=1 Tax=Paraburkholderia sp. J12 TaxID=2805432 RepID=UPI002ABD7509|nr:hypothetical protein [Paraburkholderia sp. J12]
MTSHHFNIETPGAADTFSKLAAKGKCGEAAPRAIATHPVPPGRLVSAVGPSRSACIPFPHEVRS